ncbi:hypothetical protein HMPREF9005_2243, partial [Actinomyces sp. oral taxon 178 str. F0338]
ASLRGSGRLQPRPQRLRSGAGGLGLGLLRGGLSGGELCFQVGDALAHRVLPSSGRAVPRSILDCGARLWLLARGGSTAVAAWRCSARRRTGGAQGARVELVVFRSHLILRSSPLLAA